jgi:hypothetical protein
MDKQKVSQGPPPMETDAEIIAKVEACVKKQMGFDAVLKDIRRPAVYNTWTQGDSILWGLPSVAIEAPHDEPMQIGDLGFVGWFYAKSHVIGIKWDQKGIAHIYRGVLTAVY